MKGVLLGLKKIKVTREKEENKESLVLQLQRGKREIRAIKETKVREVFLVELVLRETRKIRVIKGFLANLGLLVRKELKVTLDQ